MTQPTLYRTIPCSERLPEKIGTHFCFHQKNENDSCRLFTFFFTGKKPPNNFTHWLEPLPADPDVRDEVIEEMEFHQYATDEEIIAHANGMKQMRDMLTAKMEAMKPKWVSIKEEYLPKANVPVLCTDGKFIYRASWIPKHFLSTDESDFEGDGDYSEETDCYYWPEGWYEWNESEDIHWSLSEKITHWMPLPEKPKTT